MFTTLAHGQIQSGSSADILHELKKLQNPTRVLYLAAHPDDENTRMISYLVNEVGAHTAYLSLTRGDGGQNLIGKELSAELGILRTQELMQARAIDGGEQFFTRAVDFGYSKTSKETLEKWGEDEILSDVVWVIRKFRPDVIITRFPPDSRAGHGHHTASAELGIKAFSLAADEKAFADQLQYVKPWQAKRIYWNASNWWNRDIDKLAANNPDYVVLDAGGYSPVIGLSSNELASLSRTQHKSQGFGVSVDRGSQKEYLQYLSGDRAVNGLFDGINQTWERYGFKEANNSLQKILSSFNPSEPYKSVPALLKLKNASTKITDAQQKQLFENTLNEIIIKCLGLHTEALATKEFVLEGTSERLKLEFLNRSPLQVVIDRAEVRGKPMEISDTLIQNEDYVKEIVLNTHKAAISQPYWINGSYQNLYPVKEQGLIGKPENDPSFEILVDLKIATGDKKLGTQTISVKVPVTYKFSDRVDGEIIRSTFVVPAVTVTPEKRQMLFLNPEPQKLKLKVQFQKVEEVLLNIETEGYEVSPRQIKVVPASEQDLTAVVEITVTPISSVSNASLSIKANGENLQTLTRINYPHINERIVLKDATVELKGIELKKKGEYIGYIAGAGDEVPEAIQQMGYEVFMLDEKTLRSQDLSEFKAIVAGIRAYNTQDWLPGVKPLLMDYVKNGGNYIVQYNTSSRDLLTRDIGPHPFEITRNRVTEEDAEPKFLIPNSPIFNKPNKLTEADFDGWVQERGLYFAGNWDSNYRTPIGWNDEGEDLQEGALIITDYGKGAFMYTGISFFRELPAGVPGAYRLLANMLSYKKSAPTNEQ